MRKRIFCRGFCLLFVLLMLAGIIPPKAFAETETAAPINLSGENFEYFDSETGYAAIIIDDLGLLKEGEGEKLLENMKPLTQFGNVAFWSTDEYTYNEIEQARLKRRSLFGLTSATIFVVNMNVRKISIQSYGLIEESINSSYANTITNNVRGYATRGDYCGAASNAYNQILQVLEGNRIAQPMKYFSNACIALMLGLIIMISAVFRHSSSFIRPSVSSLLAYTVGGAVTAYALKRVLTGTERHYSPVTSSSSGSSCSSCGGGGGGGCSSCGSGGSSSF